MRLQSVPTPRTTLGAACETLLANPALFALELRQLNWWGRRVLTKDHAQEGLSRAYIHAISAAARAHLTMGSEFDYGFDGSFDTIVKRQTQRGAQTPRNRHVKAGYPIEFQLKCSWNWRETPTSIVWGITSKTYNDLVSRPASACRAILILMCLPRDERHWVNSSESHMQLQRCCYYTTLEGDPIESEDTRRSIQIPRENIFNATNLARELAAEKVRREEMFG
ncbi:DUF4365 domain-containing protein [Aureimonas ureilytica]|uniref:DUF4365 domain-containing protein n=1 Tax=Aureimonas ureilytica TaxID=401562 RepID=UPI0009E676AC|nr:DUF4365 domain-containing protein [Aureimonas ureilytica]